MFDPVAEWLRGLDSAWVSAWSAVCAAALAAVGGAAGLYQLRHYRHEARLSRRPVLETHLTHARPVAVGEPLGGGKFRELHRQTLGVRLVNVGEGRAVSVDLYARFTHVSIDSSGAKRVPLSKREMKDFVAAATHRGTAENIRAGMELSLDLDGPNYERGAFPFMPSATAHLLVKYTDVYGATYFTPVMRAAFWLDRENPITMDDLPDGAVLRSATPLV